MRTPMIFLLFCLTYAATVTLGQTTPVTPGVDEIEKEVKELFELNKYDKAVVLLERATSSHSSEVKLTSLLGTAYLCSASGVGGAKNVEKARAAMVKAIESGGDAVILVSKAKPQGRLTRGSSIVAATPGELHINRKTLSFIPARDEEPAGPFSKDDLKECGLNSGYGKDSNAFHIKTSKTTLDFRPLHFAKYESDLACSLAEKYLDLKYSK